MTEPAAKRQKRSAADELICSITLELPLVPVTAMDGKVYERSAIEEWFEGKAPDQIKSPLTGKIIGKHLLPAEHIKNTIEILIENGSIEGNLAEKWTKRAKQEKEKEKLQDKAENGNAEAMYDLGLIYYHGRITFKPDFKLAYQWFSKAKVAGHVGATAYCGQMLVTGCGGTTKNDSQGIAYLSEAAVKGSDIGAYLLGFGFAEGDYGLPVDETEACRWLEIFVSGNSTYKKLGHGNGYFKMAQEKLVELKKR